MSKWGPKWDCHAKAAPDCVLINGPICKACNHVVDSQWAQEIKLDFNRRWSFDEPHAQRFCETMGCWGLVRKVDWETKRCHAFLKAGDISGCNVPGAFDGLKREADHPPVVVPRHPPLRACIYDSLTMIEGPGVVGSAAAAPPPPPPPPPVAAEVADVPNTISVPAKEATMRSSFNELMKRIDDMKMGLQDVKDDLCEFYHVYVEELEEQTALPVQTRVSPRSSSAGSLVQTALPQEAPAAVQEAPAAVEEAPAVQEAPRSRSRFRRRVWYGEGGHVKKKHVLLDSNGSLLLLLLL